MVWYWRQSDLVPSVSLLPFPTPGEANKRDPGNEGATTEIVLTIIELGLPVN